MMEATAGIQAAGDTGFLLKTLFTVAHSEEKEARRIFAMDWLVTSVPTDTLTIYRSITDDEGFRVVSRHGKNPLPLPVNSDPSRAAPLPVCVERR